MKKPKAPKKLGKFEIGKEELLIIFNTAARETLRSGYENVEGGVVAVAKAVWNKAVEAQAEATKQNVSVKNPHA